MDCQPSYLDYGSTGFFSPLIRDYLDGRETLKPFYRYSPIRPPFREIIAARKAFPTDRALLVNELEAQYRQEEPGNLIRENIRSLASANTFTVCTAHQPNLFTGYLYFVYKILQTIRLSEQLNLDFPDLHFVPVYYMGSEDNDLEELGMIQWAGQPLRWVTRQTGSFGRMSTDGIGDLIGVLAKSLGKGAYALDLIGILRRAYEEHPDIQSATRYLVNALFGAYGLLVLVADTPGFKGSFRSILREELWEQSSFPIVQATASRLSVHYPIQVHPRELNLFYLDGANRERIIRQGESWQVLNTGLRFGRRELEVELEQFPEHFSPNVILRTLLQESILPNLAFIAGGSELSYWMEFSDLFDHYRIPFPLLLQRNSFLLVNARQAARRNRLGLEPGDLFLDTESLVRRYLLDHSGTELGLNGERESGEALFFEIRKRAAALDPTLEASVGAEQRRLERSLDRIALKFLRAEKKKKALQTSQIRRLKQELFPGGQLQERVENLLPYYAARGPEWIETLHHYTDPLVNRFTILEELSSHSSTS